MTRNMSENTNRHGLTRNIPEDVKLQVRQACGFGCVECGASIVEYEHVNPEFKDAVSHTAEGIALLCASCHGNVTRKFWSKERIAKARKNPFCKREGFSWGGLDIGSKHPVIRFAGVSFRKCRIPVEVRGTPLFLIENPEADGAPFRLSATFCDSKGTPLFLIRQNVWESRSGVWDTQFVGGRISIHDEQGSQSLAIRLEPPTGLAVERVDMMVNGYGFRGDSETLTVTTPGGGQTELTGCGVDGGRVGISLG